MKPRRPIRRATPARAKELAKYRLRKKEFLEECCLCDKCNKMVPFADRDLHHFYGRVGALLNYVLGFRLVHAKCHTWIETHRNEAVKLGLRAPDSLFNRPSKVIPKSP